VATGQREIQLRHRAGDPLIHAVAGSAEAGNSPAAALIA
jgi:hypothetical protein